MKTIQFLPPELLSIILEFACRSTSSDAEKGAQVVGLVSKTWRTILFNTPSIWTSFYVGGPRHTKRLQNRLARSGGLPLDIHVKDASSRFGVLREQLSKLSNSSDRWQSLNISHPEAVTIMEQFVPSVLPNVRVLSVKATPRQFDPSLHNFYSFLPDYSSPPTFSLNWTGLHLEKLQTLEISNIIIEPKAVASLLDFLQACSHLQRLALNHVWERGTYRTAQNITLQSLQELELVGISSSHVLRWIVAPTLKRLVVGKRTLPRKWWAPVEIETHYATATDVTLIRFSTVPAALRNILRAVPLVSNLTLLQPDIRSPYLPVAEAILQEQALPCLTNLHIQGASSLVQLRKVVEVHRETLTRVEAHCLDLGLAEESLAKDYQERDEALNWLKLQPWFTFMVDHGPGVMGDRYWSHQDQKWGRKMECSTPGHYESTS